ncbi:IclR family transcriptional regulator [Antarcticirhabdus aurantiaca]|uniref:IclR family transcriptional regulator n=1 Tax=Antarcticirhabdus aurantiaca TaxID=2606717 RepID=A0ACD4NKJ7_9HYPH|nr:IclR family transcriptional regulator [Antarcticirhabdus aurantiaca]WAJ27345.1 IclR family transcriptional regulator [Jeongeuplla avenae]
MSEAEDRYRAPALDKGLDILELLASTDEDLSQAEIAKTLQRSPNEIYRMLDRLVRRDYIRRTADDRYHLTLKLFELGVRHRPLKRLLAQAEPAMRRFAHATAQACHLVVQDRSLLTVVAQFDSPDYWNVSIRVGARIRCLGTGSGHVMLAYARPEERALLLQASGEAGEPGPDFEGELQAIREAGHAVVPSRQTVGVTNLTVPIVNPLGSVHAVLTCPFTPRLDSPEAPGQEDVLDQLRLAARAISDGEPRPA